ncbi:unnamed protein product [Microthlaspi erraticum]|uniref:Uncharacterized protein n=1 Tax=Microthlaspi erraticum TaxID=1685480 RepID=A0A6D2L6G7_9BRAS|nr:unnamed protein product [Microthlaspi erraticum]
MGAAKIFEVENILCALDLGTRYLELMAKEQTGGDDQTWTGGRSEQSVVERNLTEQSIEHKETECLRKCSSYAQL